MPDEIWNKEIEPEAMLNDMFDGGIYGKGNGERKLSGSLTLDVDTQQNSWLSIVFPSKSRLSNRYSILHEKANLYPLYVIVRWKDLLKEYVFSKEGRKDLKQKVQVSEERRKLLEYYRG